MTESEFVWWLRGYLGKDVDVLTEKQLKMIKGQLKRVGEVRELSDQQKVDTFAVYS
jgi:hypothetical protein